MSEDNISNEVNLSTLNQSAHLPSFRNLDELARSTVQHEQNANSPAEVSLQNVHEDEHPGSSSNSRQSEISKNEIF